MQSTIGAALQTGLLPRKDVIALLQAHIGRNYRATGEALRQIKTIGSWKREGFESYGQYCEAIWGISEERADLLIQCWALSALLRSRGIDEKDLPQSEEVAITLVKVEGAGDIVQFWKKLLENHNARAISPKIIYKAIKLAPGSFATITNPAHPHFGMVVQIKKRVGETLHVFGPAGIHGRQILLSAELMPCLPPELAVAS